MNGIYTNFFNIINQYIFGGGVLDVTSYEHMVCVIGATTLCVIVTAVPFIIVRWFFRGFGR